MYACMNRPKNDEQWFERETPSDFPQPLMNLGSVNIPSVLPYLSPKNKQLTGPTDLLDYWVQTGGSNPMEDPLASAYITGRFPDLEEIDSSIG